MSTLPEQSNHQQILAQHIFDLHTEINKLSMETWRSLRREEITNNQLDGAQELLVRMEKRLQYMKNCCYWIREEYERQKEELSENQTDETVN